MRKLTLMKPSLIICLDNLRSAYNVGSIFRTADAVGKTSLYLAGYTPLPLSAKVAKTALGSTASVPWVHYCSLPSCLSLVREQGFRLVACETGSEAKSLFSYRFSPRTCLVFGNEIVGIQPVGLELADDQVAIPQYGLKESLNVATAAGILMYSYRRQFPN